MKHSIISWDCSYRNFFHLIDGLLFQDYSKEEFELIYVEQRSREVSNKHNNDLGLETLEDKFNEAQDKINIKILYLNEPVTAPYHLGRCNNAGLEIAQGEIISVMDGDQLLPKDFLVKLTTFHEQNQRAVVNIHRKMAQHPVGVKYYQDWTKAQINFYKCLNACPSKYRPIPETVNNFGPMISARKKYWHTIGGYDTHKIWSTGLSKLGADTNSRLEITTNKQSVNLPNCFAVHPWHPTGIGSLRSKKLGIKYLSLQDKLISWAVTQKQPNHQARKQIANKLYESNRDFVDDVIYADLNEQLRNDIPSVNLLKVKLKCKYSQLKTIVA